MDFREQGYRFVGNILEKNVGMAPGTIREYVHHVTKGRRSTAAYVAQRTADCLQTGRVTRQCVTRPTPDKRTWSPSSRERQA